MNDTKADLVGGLNDSCFAFASESLSTLCRMIETETGEKPTIADLCQVIAESLRCCQGDLLRDVNVHAVEKLSAKVSTRKKVTAKPGDVFAIAAVDGGYYLLIYITSNRFGEAFGVLDGVSKLPHVPAEIASTPLIPPLYTGKTFVTNGRWRRIASREELLTLFPSSPDIFHSKSDNPTNDTIGAYGSAELATGELRDLTEPESEKIGLSKGTYQQVLLEEQVEALLRRVLG
ncbi:MAG: hypothetical protein COA78_11355 [Blastopirellula sp.]|nr:MAG: hypothetical protein COA78_11355 [Blastopirellula sp.]